MELHKAKTTEQIKNQFLGDPDLDNLDDTNFDDIDQTQKTSSGIFSKFTSALKNYIGNKILTEEDLKPVMDELVNLLLEKCCKRNCRKFGVKV